MTMMQKREVYEGYNGQITIDGDALLLTRQGRLAKLTFADTTARRIPLAALSGVGFQPATRLRNGWLHFAVGGAPATELNIGTAGSEVNTVLFTHGKRERFEALHAWIAKVVATNVAGPGACPVGEDIQGGQGGRIERHAGRLGERADALRQRESDLRGERP